MFLNLDEVYFLIELNTLIELNKCCECGISDSAVTQLGNLTETDF